MSGLLYSGLIICKGEETHSSGERVALWRAVQWLLDAQPLTFAIAEGRRETLCVSEEGSDGVRTVSTSLRSVVTDTTTCAQSRSFHARTSTFGIVRGPHTHHNRRATTARITPGDCCPLHAVARPRKRVRSFAAAAYVWRARAETQVGAARDRQSSGQGRHTQRCVARSLIAR